MSNTPITSSASMVTVLQQQLADVAAAKTQALTNIQAVLQDTLGGASYTITTEGDTQTVNKAEYLRTLNDQVKSLGELEGTLLETLQNLQPFNLVQRQTIGNLRRGIC